MQMQDAEKAGSGRGDAGCGVVRSDVYKKAVRRGAPSVPEGDAIGDNLRLEVTLMAF
jgi:hypothetical protein